MSSEAICVSWLEEIQQGIHQPGDTYKIALYTSAASIDHETEEYSSTNEASGAGYVAGGKILTGFATGRSGKTAWTDFADASWPNSTITARYALIYNATRGNRAVKTLDFLVTKMSSNGPFDVEFPTPAASTALLRLTGP